MTFTHRISKPMYQ